jgi:hypothetical protein
MDDEGALGLPMDVGGQCMLPSGNWNSIKRYRMAIEIHFLNVDHGDCTIIEYPSDRLTMIDI